MEEKIKIKEEEMKEKFRRARGDSSPLIKVYTFFMLSIAFIQLLKGISNISPEQVFLGSLLAFLWLTERT